MTDQKEDNLEMFGLDIEQMKNLQDADVSDVPETKWAPFLAALVAVLEARKRHGGHPKDVAFREAQKDVLAIAEYLGGRVAYLPRGDALKRALRDAEIYRKFTGNNHEQLAVQYNLNVIHIYTIVKQQKQLHMRRNQGRLFSD